MALLSKRVIAIRVLVAGASGLIGWIVCDNLVNRQFEVFVGEHAATTAAGRPIQLDVTNDDSIEKALLTSKADALVNLVAFTNVDICEERREWAFRLNAEAAQRMASICSRLGALLLHFSTDYVFDGLKGGYSESDETCPVNYYGLTKVEGEKRVAEIARDFCIARTSTPYGKHPIRRCFPKFVIERLKNGETVRVIRDQITSPTYIPNLGEMLADILEKGVRGVIHLAGASAVSRLELAHLLAKSFSFNEQLIIESTMDEMGWPARRPKNSSLDVSKATQLLPTKPITMAQGIRSFLLDLGYGM